MTEIDAAHVCVRTGFLLLVLVRESTEPMPYELDGDEVHLFYYV
jgi:hypothetical protein